MNWEQYQTAYQAADDSTKALVDGEKIPQCVQTTVNSHQLDASHQRLLIQLCTYRALGVTSTESLQTNMKAAGVPNAEVVITELLTCIGIQAVSSIPKPEIVTEKKTDELNAEIKEAEAALESIPKIRTMAQDMRGTQTVDETVHTSSQEELLRKES